MSRNHQLCFGTRPGAAVSIGVCICLLSSPFPGGWHRLWMLLQAQIQGQSHPKVLYGPTGHTRAWHQSRESSSKALPASRHFLPVKLCQSLLKSQKWMSFCSAGGGRRSSGAGNLSPISGQCRLDEVGCDPCPGLKGQSPHPHFKKVLSSAFQHKPEESHSSHRY